MNLRIPGPTPLPPDVLAAMSQQMIDHRGPEFEAMMGEVTVGLKTFFETQHDLLILTASGTGGLEAAIVNTLSPGDRVLAVSVGVFGNRFAEIAAAYGASVTKLSYPMGQAADPDEVAAKIAQEGPFAAVLFTHNETSTGVSNVAEALCRAIRSAAPESLILVDAISSVPAIRLQTDAWGCDVVVAGSQKAWMAPPGASFVSMSPRAWEAYEHARMPRFYFDLGQAKKYADQRQTPATPAMSVFFALRASLNKLAAEGPEAVWARHEHLGAYCRQGVLDLGLGLFAAEGHRSNTVTAISLTPGQSAAKILAALRERYDIIGGATRAPGVEMIRLAHMGYVSEADLDAVFVALRELIA